ncbi:MAG: SAM-dependent chlorinase/fluorinase [Burkholderiales bacterium]|nr:SAM-dependent chlorinase/fluorinase [Burkholderiales bacterium]
MAILLFTDYGASDLYVGQIETMIDRYAPGVRVISLLNELPCYQVRCAAHLLAAMARTAPRGHTFLTVVQPGGGARTEGLVVRVDGRTFVGPDNGLLSVLWARGNVRTAWRITTHAPLASDSFHGRDIFAPMAAAVATGDFPNETVTPIPAPAELLSPDDLAEVIYIDHFGNAFTGLRGADLAPDRVLSIGGQGVQHARALHEAPPGQPVWYVNSIGLVEIAVPGASAAADLGLSVGQSMTWA